MKNCIHILLLPLALCACGPDEHKVEENAARMVHAARSLMIEKDYDSARDSILKMRKTYPKAFKARTTAIVVLDSIELLESQDSLAAFRLVVQGEEELLSRLQAERKRGDNGNYLRQKTKVFHLQQQLDEMEAKVKFYHRKIEVDINNALEDAQQD